MLENAVEILKALGMIVGGFAVLATMTKNTSDNKILDAILKGINFLGANVIRAKNG
jgi:hypothetical protein